MSKKTSARRKLDPIRVQMAEKTQRVKHDLAMKMVSERVKIDAEFAADVLKIGGENLREDIKKDAHATIANARLPKVYPENDPSNPEAVQIVQLVADTLATPDNVNQVLLNSEDAEQVSSCCGSCGCEDHGHVLDKQQVRDYMEKNNLSPMIADGGCNPVEVPKEQLQDALTKLSEIQAEKLKEAGLT